MLLHSQTKQIEVDLEESVVDLGFNTDGSFYIVDGKKPKMIILYKGNRILRFSNDLSKKDQDIKPDIKFEVEASSPTGETFKISESKMSRGNLFSGYNFSDHYLVQEGVMSQLVKRKEVKSKIKSKVSFLTDKYSFYLGNEKKGLDLKSKGKVEVIRMNNNNLEKDFFTLQLPNDLISFGEEVIVELAALKKDSFILALKDMNEDLNKSVYNLVEYNFDMEFISSTSVNVNLEGKCFMASNNGAGRMSKNVSTGVTVLTKGAISNVHYTEEGFYIYGVFTDKKKKINSTTIPKGFYIHKFDKEGKLLWKENKLVDKGNLFNDKQFGPNIDLDLYESKDRVALSFTLSLKKGSSVFYEFNKENGTILQEGVTENVKYTYEFKSVGGKYELFYTLKEDSFKKKKLDGTSLYAMYTNSEFKNYVSNLEVDKKEVTFVSSITPEQITLIHYDNQTCRVVQFKN